MGTTIKDIADLAGVSTATVSRVINNSGFVKSSTRKVINDLLEKQNYVAQTSMKRRGPKLSKSTLLKYHSFTMIWAGGYEASLGLTAQGMLLGLSEAAGAIGATLNIEVIARNGGLPDVLNNGRTDGIFLNGHGFSEAFFERAKSFPVVWLLQAGSHDFGDRVQPDHTQAGILAYDYLLNKGCTNLCCISCNQPRKYPSYWQTREQAFANAARTGNIPCEVINLDYSDSQNDSMEIHAATHEAVERIKGMKKRPDGIFVANALGFPLYSELTANGIVPSRDLEMVAGDKEVCGGYCNPEPVKIDIHPKNIGKLAFETMIWRLQHPEMPLVTHSLKPSLIIPDNPGRTNSK